MPETKIKDALIGLCDAIKDSDMPGITRALKKIEALHVAHAAELSPQLEHFLSDRSYAKALTYLGGGEHMDFKPASPPGGCGGGRL